MPCQGASGVASSRRLETAEQPCPRTCWRSSWSRRVGILMAGRAAIASPERGAAGLDAGCDTAAGAGL
jgi:hypothetical protein